MRDKGAMKNTIMQGKVEGERNRGRPRRMYTEDIRQWKEMDLTTEVKRAEDKRKGGGMH